MAGERRQLQYSLGEGPCVATCHEDEPVLDLDAARALADVATIAVDGTLPSIVVDARSPEGPSSP